MSKKPVETKIVKRRIGADTQRLKEVLMDTMPNTDVVDETSQNEDLTVAIVDSEPSSSMKAEKEPKPKKKAPGNKRSYQLEELISTLKLINEGKGLDEISKLTGRSPASLLYKYHSPRGLLNIRTEEGVREWWAKRSQEE